MGKGIVAVIVVLSITSTIFLCSTVALYILRENEIEKRLSVLEERDFLQGELKRVGTERDKLSNELAALEQKRQELQDKASMLQRNAEQLQAQLISERTTRQQLESQLASRNSKDDDLRRSVKDAEAVKKQVMSELNNVKIERDGLDHQLDAVRQAKEALENKLQSLLLNEEVQLGKIIVNPEEEQAAPAAEELSYNAGPPNDSDPGASRAQAPAELEPNQGHVLVVNKKFDFAVVDIGAQNGLETGTGLGVFREGKMIAMLEVEKVHSNMSAAKIPPEWKGARIREGDIVTIAR